MDENLEIREIYQKLNDDSERNDGRAVDEWFAARQINEEDFHGYTAAAATKAIEDMMRTGVIDEDMLAARFAACFQLGFEVAAKRYLAGSMPPMHGQGGGGD